MHKIFFRRFCQKAPHIPVMSNEVLNYLKPESNQLILDMTFGAGGHSRKILETAPKIRLIALDRDPTAHNYALELAQEFPGRVMPLLGRFSEVHKLLQLNNIGQNSLDGILFDFGCSSMQFDNPDRGFSLSKNGPLDMRMDSDRFPDDVTAADILAGASEVDLYKIIKVYGEEKNARKIARAIIEARQLFKNLATTEDLVDVIESVFGENTHRKDKLGRPSHNATKTFQALRIFVNNELNEINVGMFLASKFLKLSGRCVAISFHSLEDTIVKRHFLGNLIGDSANPLPLKYSSHSYCAEEDDVKEMMQSNWLNLTKNVVVPSYDEIEENPRSRSAKLRAAARIR